MRCFVKILKYKFGSGLFVFLMLVMVGLLAYVDDIEIFFGGVVNVVVRLNILFILDILGLMDVYDGEILYCMDCMKNVFYDLLSGMNNVNIGLMCFNDLGGLIFYFIMNIDELILDFLFYNGFMFVCISFIDGDVE